MILEIDIGTAAVKNKSSLLTNKIIFFRFTQKFLFVEGFEFTQFLPFTVLIAMYLITGESLTTCFIMFLWILTVGSIAFGWIGLNAAHHHPDIFHDGDAIR